MQGPGPGLEGAGRRRGARGRMPQTAVPVQGLRRRVRAVRSRPGTTRSAWAFHDASLARRRRRVGHSHSTGSGKRVNAVQARPTAPEPGNRSSSVSPGAAPSSSKIHRHTAAGLTPITWPGSVSSGATPHTIESARRLLLISWRPPRRGPLDNGPHGQGFVKVVGGVQPGDRHVRSSSWRARRGSWAQRRVSSVYLVTPCMRKRVMTRLARADQT